MKLILVQPQLRMNSAGENLHAIRSALLESQVQFGNDDIVVLPEGIERSDALYRPTVAALARELGCHVVGGSRPEPVGQGKVNAGLFFAPDGSVLGRYEKQRPYAREREAVDPGRTLGEFSLAGRSILVLICADFFWFADLIHRAARTPDLILVAALSVTRKATPDYARAIWRHMAFARAYESAAFVGISDWAFPSRLSASFASGVAGFADPTETAPDRFFQPVAERGVAAFPIDFEALDAFRADRIGRGFLARAAQGSERIEEWA